MKIAILKSTNRKNSTTHSISEYYKTELEKNGHDVDWVDLEILPILAIANSMYKKNENKDETFLDYQNRLQTADRIFVIFPEYNGSYPGLLKYFIDALTFPDSLKGKVIAITGISSGNQGGAVGSSHLADIFSYLGAWVVPMRLRLPQIKLHFDYENQLLDEEYKKLIALQIQQATEPISIVNTLV
jgi:NAD(P)H-dependent FMN reductase